MSMRRPIEVGARIAHLGVGIESRFVVAVSFQLQFFAFVPLVLVGDFRRNYLASLDQTWFLQQA